ncbi:MULTISPECIES: hypothetical protein [unclassified Pseudomonas]|uniref:hypothetical protein n=1 Tax=unclassified Pseudomonas TaxID=196821 RepID=UPI0024489139|nr:MULTISPECIES: hypothetical protein [unclassified Pseudomonas]MDH0895919.1 hypothetical protein [Pseudomonas sp. GD03875]MDH1067174.1 hypothetical protein [Pseudomonas sp. GD03985]
MIHEPLVASAIVPLVQRHVGDAAFYWAQRDGSIESPHLDLARLRHVDRLLQAHLDGVVVAGEEGWQQALQALKRWQGPGEAFVCAVLGLTHGDGERLQVLWPLIAKQPERLARGLVSALAWMTTSLGQAYTPWIEHWLAHAESPLLKAIALRAATSVGMLQTEVALAACTAVELEMRVAGCKALTLAVQSQVSLARQTLLAALHDPALRVRGAAASSLLLAAGESDTALDSLRITVIECAQALHEAHGREKSAVDRRLRNWLRTLAVHLPLGHGAIPDLLDRLSDRHALEFIVWHGDFSHAHLLLEMASQADLAQGALWALHTLTGQGKLLEQSHAHGMDEAAASAKPGHFAGMPYPDLVLWRRWWSEQGPQLPRGKRLLYGKALGDDAVLDHQHCLNLLLEGDQRTRHLAAVLSARYGRAQPINIRERAHRQITCLGVALYD